MCRSDDPTKCLRAAVLQKTISADCYFHYFLGIMDTHHTEPRHLEDSEVEMSNNDFTPYTVEAFLFVGFCFYNKAMTNSKRT